MIGYRLRELRKENNMSQADLGKLLGVSKVSVSGYENGNRIPSVEILTKILDIFHISADYILGKELNVVCESDSNISVNLSSVDINIIRELRKKNDLFNKIAVDPKRFFNSLVKKGY